MSMDGGGSADETPGRRPCDSRAAMACIHCLEEHCETSSPAAACHHCSEEGRPIPFRHPRPSKHLISPENLPAASRDCFALLVGGVIRSCAVAAAAWLSSVGLRPDVAGHRFDRMNHDTVLPTVQRNRVIGFQGIETK
ncbi:hypothetical protein LIA77_03241 [Sarocladium implicatum]|nr:hypothetical protein LIA77_03241 [Sarocladium implicatum]